MHSSYIPPSRSSSRRHVRSNTPTRSQRHRNPETSSTRGAYSHRRRLSNPASLGAGGGAPHRPVTPTAAEGHSGWAAAAAAPTPAAMDSPRSLPLSYHPHAVPPEVVLGHSYTSATSPSRGHGDLRLSYSADQRSVISDMGKTYNDATLPTSPTSGAVPDEMPMDEAEEVMQKVSPAALESMRHQMEESQKEVERLTLLLQQQQQQQHLQQQQQQQSNNNNNTEAVDAADRGGGVGGAMADDVSSLGDEDDDDDHTAPKLSKLIQGMEQSRKPSSLSAEERDLWDAYQKSLTNAKVEASKERTELERRVLESGSQLNQIRVRERILQDQLDETKQDLQSLQSELRNEKEVKSKSLEEQQRLKATQAMTLRRLEDQLAEMETKYQEAHELVESQQEEHDRAICAIQRVLADATAERDKAMEELQTKLNAAQPADASAPPFTSDGARQLPECAQRAVESTAGTTNRTLEFENEIASLRKALKTAERDRDSLRQDLDDKGGQIVIFEQELSAVKAALEKANEKADDLVKRLEEKTQAVVDLEGELASAKHEVETVTKREEEMLANVEATKKEIHTLRRRQRHMRLGESEASGKSREAPAVSTGEVTALQEQLADTQSSLENAKKIILSLETANGSLASDLRGKLKEKEESVQSLQTEATERKRTLDSLATELRELQRRKGEMDRKETYSRNLVRKQQVLALELETALNNLQEAAIVFESSVEGGTADPEAIDNISRILANALGSVKYASMDVKDSTPTPERSFSYDSSQGDGTETPKHTRAELEERKIQVNRLEEALKQHKEELEALRRESTKTQLKREEDERKLRSEILNLREQCKTNMEVLAKKERELEVLRDSLDVDGDDGVGYISDDASSYGEEDEARAPEAPLSPGAGSVYSHSQAEALATLMANGSGMDAASVSSTNMEVDKLRKDLGRATLEREKAAKELKAERESLANAKMIISSLERANKSMMEDLRQRLQDSNTAIASLLDKSMQSEKLSTSLKAELETVKKDREEDEAKHKAEVQKLKDRSVEQARAMAAKDREIQELLRKQQGGPISLEQEPAEPAEERKQDN